jgi:hypothetical protein
MRKQTVRVLSKCGSYTVRWFSVEEAQTCIDQGNARIASRRPMAIRLVAHADPNLKAENSKGQLTRGDMAMLASLPKGFVKKLDETKVREMSPATIAGLQRLAGWGLLPRNEALENAEC